MCNRVGLDASFVVSWATLAFVLIIAIGATYVRVQSANKLMDDAVRMQKSELREQQAVGAGLDLGRQNVIPDADAKSSIDADGKAVDEATQYDLNGYWVTFAILAVLFVFLQGLGVLFGYRWGFAGQSSKAAFKAVGKGKYLLAQQDDERAGAFDAGRAPASTQDRTRAPRIADVPAPAGQARAAELAGAGEIDTALRELDRFGNDAEARRSYLNAMPEHVFAEVKAVLQERKQAQEAAKARRAAELEDLL